MSISHLSNGETVHEPINQPWRLRNQTVITSCKGPQLLKKTLRRLIPSTVGLSAKLATIASLAQKKKSFWSHTNSKLTLRRGLFLFCFPACKLPSYMVLLHGAIITWCYSVFRNQLFCKYLQTIFKLANWKNV